VPHACLQVRQLKPDEADWLYSRFVRPLGRKSLQEGAVTPASARPQLEIEADTKTAQILRWLIRRVPWATLERVKGFAHFHDLITINAPSGETKAKRAARMSANAETARKLRWVIINLLQIFNDGQWAGAGACLSCGALLLTAPLWSSRILARGHGGGHGRQGRQGG
jgi:hypothetical protein